MRRLAALALVLAPAVARAEPDAAPLIAATTDEELLEDALERAEQGGEVIEVHGVAPEAAAPATHELDEAELRRIPGAGNDALRALSILPGFARAPYGMGAVIVRGVSPRNSGVYLDGVRVPLAFHFLGVTSFYPSSMLDRVEAYPSAATVRYGRTLGAVIELEARRGRPDRWRLGGEVGLLDASAQAEGPAGGGALLVGVRRSYVDAVLAGAGLGDGALLPSYLDAQIRYDHGDPTERGGAWSATLIASDDRIGGVTDGALGFVRLIGAYRRSEERWSFRLSPWVGKDRSGVYLDPHETYADDEVIETERFATPFGLRAELVNAASYGEWSFGIDVEGGSHGPTRTTRMLNAGIPAEMVDFKYHEENADLGADFGFWAEWMVRLADDRVTVRPGARIDRYGHKNEGVFDPRITVSERVTGQLTLRQSAAIQHQPPSPADLAWAESNKEIKSSWASHLVVGAELQLTPATRIGVATYRIDGQRLPVVREAPDGVEVAEQSERWDERTEDLGIVLDELLEAQIGTFGWREDEGWMNNRGVELDVRHASRFGDAWLAYTWSRARREGRTLMGNAATQEDAYTLDQPHVLSAVFSRQLGRWQVGGRFRFASGNPTVVATEQVEAHHVERLPSSYAIDLRVDRAWRRGWGTIVGYLDLTNVTNHRAQEGPSTKGLPILPFVGVAFRPE
jgi:hypothetical protein